MEHVVAQVEQTLHQHLQVIYVQQDQRVLLEEVDPEHGHVMEVMEEVTRVVVPIKAVNKPQIVDLETPVKDIHQRDLVNVMGSQEIHHNIMGIRHSILGMRHSIVEVMMEGYNHLSLILLITKNRCLPIYHLIGKVSSFLLHMHKPKMSMRILTIQ
jgi:hypothetical protein